MPAGRMRAPRSNEIRRFAGSRFAVLVGLRQMRDETQLTRTIAEVARADSRFAAAFVQVLLDGVKRLRAIRRLPPDRRAVLLAVTRAVPAYGESGLAGEKSWLGSVRWAHLRDGLLSLSPSDPELALDWTRLVTILDEQGDLGMTQVDVELIQAWGRYLEDRDHLTAILDQIWSRATEILRAELYKRYKSRATDSELVAVDAKGKRVKREQRRVYFSLCVPAIVLESAIDVQFDNTFGVPHFTCQVRPWEAKTRLEERDPELMRADDELRAHGFQGNGECWAQVHAPGDYLDADDVPAQLLEMISTDFAQIVASGILDLDVAEGLSKRRGGPRRHRRLPSA